MHEKVKPFLKMFELEDLQKDIELLIEQYKDEHDHEIISNYVFLENIALMSNELFGVNSFIEVVRSTHPAEYTDTRSLIDDLTKNLPGRCRQKGIASAAYILAERKMSKVLAYIEGAPC